MANIIDVTLKLIDQLSQPLQAANAKLMDSGRQWQKAGKQIEKVGTGIAQAGQTITTAVTVPIVGAATVCANKFAEVDKTMQLVNATMNNSAEEAAILDTAMKSAAANSVFGMSDAAQAALNFARGGWDAVQAANALAPAMNLAAGEGGDLDTVSAGLMATMNSFGASADQATEYADVFANACNNSALDVNSLANSFSIAAPVFQAAGGSVYDAATAMGVMANAGIDANVAATSLKTGIARLASPAKEGAKWMERLGINIFDDNGVMKDMVTVQSELAGAFSTLNNQEQEAAASAIFGKNQMSPWLALISAAPADVDAFSDSLYKMGTTEDMANSMMSGFGGSIEKLKSSIDILATSLGQTLAPYLQKASDYVQGLVDKFNALEPEQRDQIVRWAAIAAAVGPAILVFGKTVVGIGKVVGVFGKFGSMLKMGVGAFTKFSAAAGGGVKVFGALKAGIGAFLGPAGIVVAILGAIVVAAVLIIKHWDEVKAAAISLWNNIVTAFNSIKDNITQAMQNAGLTLDYFKEKFQPVIDASKRLWDAIVSLWENCIKPVISALIIAYQDMWSKIQPVIMNVWRVMQIVFGTYFKALFETVVMLVKTFWETFCTLIDVGITFLTGLINFLVAVFQGDWEEAWRVVTETFQEIWQSLVDWFGGIVETITGWLNSIIELVGQALAGLSGLGDAFSTGGVDGAINYIVGSNATGTDYWHGGLTRIHEKGGEIIDLPRGSRVYPHDQSVQMAYQRGQQESNRNITISIPKLADSISVRSASDVDAIAQAIADKLEKVAANIGDRQVGYAY